MNTETNFMIFENLTKFIEEHKKETHPYKRYEFDSASYTLLLMSINNLIKENEELKKQLHEASLTIQEMTEQDIECPSNCEKLDKLLKENQTLKKHLKIPKTCNLKTLEDYKSYYEDTTREQILEDTYIEYCAYVNLAHRYSELKKQLEEIEFIVGLRQKRNLISKFDKEYDEEDKKKNPNRDYAGIMPDAEEVYRRYYTMKTQQKEFIKYLEAEINKCQSNIFADGVKYGFQLSLSKYKEIIGDDNK